MISVPPARAARCGQILDEAFREVDGKLEQLLLPATLGIEADKAWWPVGDAGRSHGITAAHPATNTEEAIR